MITTNERDASVSTSTSPSSQADHVSDDSRRAATRYVEQVRAFQAHAGLFAIGMLTMFGVNLFTNLSAGIASEWSAWWSAWALLGWTPGLAVHGLVVWLNRPMSSSPIEASP